jgi:hypothetical protein
MPDPDVQSQGTLESNAAGTTDPSHSASLESAVDSRIAACERLVDEAVEKNLPATALADSLKELGLKAVEAADYIEELNQRVEIRRSKAKRRESPLHDPPSAEVSGEVPAQDPEERDRAVEEAAWATLRAKLEATAQSPPSGLSSNVLDKVFELLGQEESLSPLSKSVLAVAPHLADDENTVFEDPHLSETQKCKIAYAGQKPFENLIIKAQGRRMHEPIANSIWRLVILDKYVDFEKLYVTLDPSYNPNDEAKELNDRFTLLEKNSISSRRSVLTEAEWMRLYDVWVDAVVLFYPHRKAELISYRELIVNMFRAALSPLPAIKYDRDSRECYSRQPYRLDSSKDALPFPLLSQLLSYVAPPPSGSSKGKKRSRDSPDGPRRRSETICQNWNLGTCEGDTCRFGRRHNECCECNGAHRAKDRSSCHTALTRRRQQKASAARSGNT